ncbi:tRNA pseudouridine(13) synthase TruD [Candidatus Woesearchaeota archaeon]|nr:tRNA pseudouridine(13) synthase TruD [Candidatus Woesearchaeota archaeon]
MILKQNPEDFLVDEILTLAFDENGNYSYYKLTKKNLNTIEAVEIIAHAFRKEIKYINFAGTKDKHAVTMQYLSIFKGPNKDIEKEFAEKNAFLQLQYLGKGKERLNLGTLDGNSFTIIARDAHKKPEKISRTINFFDNQRFGRNENNHIIGKLLMKQKFKEACEMIGLTAENNNFVKALQQLHKKKLQMYIHAYQSYLFNLTCTQYIEEKYNLKQTDYNLKDLERDNRINKIKIPIIGFGFDCEAIEDKSLKNILLRMMENEKITPRDFVIRSLQGMSAEGNERDLFVAVQNLKIEEIDKKTYKISFFLQKGSYATIAVKSMFI